MHSLPIPLGGGVAVVLAAIGGIGIAFASGWVASPVASSVMPVLGLLLTSCFLCALGVADDCGWMRGRHKLLGQFLVALILTQFGVVVRHVSFLDWRLDLGICAVPVTLAWLLGAINSLNLIDGMDGLLSIVTTVIAAGLGLLAMLNGCLVPAVIAAGLVGGVLGFLRYNFPPATMFMGDSGSMVIGLVLGAVVIMIGADSSCSVGLIVPVALFTIPLMDTTAAIVRRKLTGRSLYATDRGHIHHCLLRRGFSPHYVLFGISGCCLFLVGGSMGASFFHCDLYALLAAGIVVGALVLTRMFGHTECSLLGHRLASLFNLASLRGLPASNQTREVRLQGSADWSELWKMLLAWSRDLDFYRLLLDINAPALHEGYHADWESKEKVSEESVLWRSELPLNVHGHTLGRIVLIGHHRGRKMAELMASVAMLVEDIEHALPIVVHASHGGPAPHFFPTKSGKPEELTRAEIHLAGDGLTHLTPQR